MDCGLSFRVPDVSFVLFGSWFCVSLLDCLLCAVGGMHLVVLMVMVALLDLLLIRFLVGVLRCGLWVLLRI